MKSRLLALSILALGATGCVDDRTYLEIYGICAMTEDCTFGDTCDVYHMGPVYYDPAVSIEWLQVAIEVHNQLPNNEDLESGRVNTNDAHVTGGSVTYEVGGVEVDSQGFFTGATIPAEGSSLVWTFLAPDVFASGEFRAKVFFTGYFDNSNDFEVGPYEVGLLVGAFGPMCATGAACPGGANGQLPVACNP